MASGIQFYTCTGIPQTIQEECCDDQQSLQTGRDSRIFDLTAACCCPPTSRQSMDDSMVYQTNEPMYPCRPYSADNIYCKPNKCKPIRKRKNKCKCCKQSTKKAKKEQIPEYYHANIPWSGLPTTYDPCVHLHFKTKTVDRCDLTQHEYMDLLATPKGYRWVGTCEPFKKRGYCKERTPKRSQKVKKQRKPRYYCTSSIPEDGLMRTLMSELCGVMSPEMMDRLRDILVCKFGLSKEDAGDYTSCAQYQKRKRTTRKICSTPRIGASHKWVKDISKMLTHKITDYILVTLSMRRTARTKHIAETVLRHLCDLTGVKTTLSTPKTQMERLLVLIADRVSMWMEDMIKDVLKKKKTILKEAIHEESRPETTESRVSEEKEKMEDTKEDIEKEKVENMEEEKEKKVEEEEDVDDKMEEEEEKEEKTDEEEKRVEDEIKTDEEEEKMEEEEEKKEEEVEKKDEEEEKKEEEEEKVQEEEKEDEEEEKKDEEEEKVEEEEKKDEEEEKKEEEEEKVEEEEKKEEEKIEEEEKDETEKVEEEETKEEGEEQPVEAEAEEELVEAEAEEELVEAEELPEEPEDEEEFEAETEEVEAEEGPEEAEKEPEDIEEFEEELLEEEEKEKEIEPVEELLEEEVKPKLMPEYKEEKEPVILPPRITVGKAFEIKAGDECQYEIKQLSSTTVVHKVAIAKDKEPPSIRKVPKTESPLNTKSLKEWAMWAKEVAGTAEEWGNWLDKTIADAEQRAQLKKRSEEGPSKAEFIENEHKQWLKDQEDAYTAFRVEKKRIQEDKRRWDKKLESKIKQESSPEVETNVHDLEETP